MHTPLFAALDKFADTESLYSGCVIPIGETERLVKRLDACQSRVKFARLEKEGHRIQYVYENNAHHSWLPKQPE
ncbi:hypothetical protein GCM10028819_07380 [Spirosoma humi]